jgi:hypothetical protein
VVVFDSSLHVYTDVRLHYKYDAVDQVSPLLTTGLWLLEAGWWSIVTGSVPAARAGQPAADDLKR